MKVTAEEGLKGLGSRGLRGREGGPGGPWPVLEGTLPGRDQREALELRQERSRSRPWEGEGMRGRTGQSAVGRRRFWSLTPHP